MKTEKMFQNVTEAELNTVDGGDSKTTGSTDAGAQGAGRSLLYLIYLALKSSENSAGGTCKQ